jgi:hypothetical protein
VPASAPRPASSPTSSPASDESQIVRLVFDDGDCYHRSARGGTLCCPSGPAASQARHPHPGELRDRRLRPCRVCYAPKRGRRSAPSPKARARRADHADAMGLLKPQVHARDCWRCVLCLRQEGPGVPLEAHHRLIRRQGGPDTLENLVSLCGPFPAGCHGWAHRAGQAEARALGLLLPAAGGPPQEEWERPEGLPPGAR